MGYMGFGLQKWIYRQKPRKPFTKSNKPVGDTFDATAYAKDDLIITGRRAAHVEDIDERLKERKERINLHRRISIFNGLLITVALLVLIAIIIYKFGQNKKSSLPVTGMKIKKKTIEEEKKEAYQMILDYGNSYLKKKDYKKAITEFKQAIKLYPHLEEAKIGLAKTYYFLCIDSNQKCEEAIKHYTTLLEKHPGSKEYLRKRAEIYTHLKQYDKADTDLNNAMRK